MPAEAATPTSPDAPAATVSPRSDTEGAAAASALAEAVAELATARDRWLRSEAELQNYRRRAQRDVEEARRDAEDRALLETIECLDDLERALAAAREAGADPAWTQGVELVAQRMRDTLNRAGVATLSPVGEPFDPREHEALIELAAPDGVAPGSVLHVERAGYRRGDRVLRAARVTVAAAPTGDA